MKNKYFILQTIVLIAGSLLIGCNNNQDRTAEYAAEDSTKNINESIEQVIPDLTGAWAGSFGNRAIALNITEQTDSIFSGNITISYREAINQEVIGTFNPTSLKIIMTDQLHSRYQGKYYGKLSEDGKNLSGDFTMDQDGSIYLFNLNKK